MRDGDRYRYKTNVSVSTDRQLNVILRPDKAELLEERRRYFKIKTNERAFITLRMQEGDDKPVPLLSLIHISLKFMKIAQLSTLYCTTFRTICQQFTVYYLRLRSRLLQIPL